MVWTCYLWSNTAERCDRNEDCKRPWPKAAGVEKVVGFEGVG
jgi:hypothetical protein